MTEAWWGVAVYLVGFALSFGAWAKELEEDRPLTSLVVVLLASAFWPLTWIAGIGWAIAGRK